MTFREGWVILNKVPTHVLTWGGWIEGPIPEGDSIVVCISGNPGVTSFYNRFLSSVHEKLGIPVWILSHAGHELPPDTVDMQMPMNEELYTLSGQIEHKAAFVEKYVPKDRNIYFIGHSVGAKIVSELMKNEDLNARTRKSYLIFPTLERIAETPNGRFLIPLLTYGLSVILFFAWVYSCFPSRLRWMCVRVFFSLTRKVRVDDNCIAATLHLILPDVLRSVFFLAMDEMKNIKELDVKALNEFGNNLKIYFAVSDGWAPLTHYETLKMAVPDIDVSIVDKKFQHAFVLETPEETATFLADEIKKERAKV